MTEKRFQLEKDTEWWFVQDNTIQVNEFGYRDDLIGEDKYRGLQQDLTEQETVDLLNKFHEENKQLGLEVSETNYEYNMLILKYQKLERENKELQEFKDKVFNSIDKTIEDETQIAENIESTIEGDYVKAVNRLTIIAFKNLKKELSE